MNGKKLADFLESIAANKKRKRAASFCWSLLYFDEKAAPVPESALTLGGRLMARYLVKKGLIRSGYNPKLGRYY